MVGHINGNCHHRPMTNLQTVIRTNNVSKTSLVPFPGSKLTLRFNIWYECQSKPYYE